MEPLVRVVVDDGGDWGVAEHGEKAVVVHEGKGGAEGGEAIRGKVVEGEEGGRVDGRGGEGEHVLWTKVEVGAEGLDESDVLLLRRSLAGEVGEGDGAS